MTTAILEAWQGLGDTIFLRPSVRELAKRYDLYVRTPWPELLEDLDVKFVRPIGTFRTQQKNLRGQESGRFARAPEDAVTLSPKANWSLPLSIPAGAATSLGIDPAVLVFDLAGESPPPAELTASPYAVVRPVTVRREWPNPRRNPDPRYVAAAATELQARGLRVISVADLKPGEEWALEPLPPADVQLHAGELGVRELMGLVKGAHVVVGGVGWIVVACPAYGTPLLVIAGGQGVYNRPEKVTAAPMDTSRVRWLFPDAYCRDCRDPEHDCPREITGFEEKLMAALEGLGS